MISAVMQIYVCLMYMVREGNINENPTDSLLSVFRVVVLSCVVCAFCTHSANAHVLAVPLCFAPVTAFSWVVVVVVLYLRYTTAWLLLFFLSPLFFYVSGVDGVLMVDDG